MLKIKIKIVMHIIKKTKDSVQIPTETPVPLSWAYGLFFSLLKFKHVGFLLILQSEHAHTLMSGFGGELGFIVCPLEWVGSIEENKMFQTLKTETRSRCFYEVFCLPHSDSWNTAAACWHSEKKKINSFNYINIMQEESRKIGYIIELGLQWWCWMK